MMKVSPALFVRQVKQEVAKITWPTKSETMQGTFVVIVLCLILAALLFVIDSVFANLIHLVIGG
ncbi:MAG: preprotein translocase subunit SecE [Alphaproteobacteria bacterium]|nr:preprotein translocase subunit SecE [Alphaproteobacteria bacterium]